MKSARVYSEPLDFSSTSLTADARDKLPRGGFTLIELLVTLVIIAILLGIGLFLFNDARVIARDTKRKTDLSVIARVLELYYQSNKVYPGTAGTWYSSLGAEPWIAGLVPNIIQSLPLDPSQSSTFRYIYLSLPQTSSDPAIPTCPNLSNGQFFILAAQLESSTDKDTIGVKIVRDCNGNNVSSFSPLSSSPNWYVLTTP